MYVRLTTHGLYGRPRCSDLQCESKKSSLWFSDIFSKRLGIFHKFFTHLLYDPFYTRLKILIQLFPTLTNLCHTKRDYPANFYISVDSRTLTSKFAYLANDVIVDVMSSCYIQHVYWHYKSVYFIVTCHRQRSTKLSTTYANVWTHAFWPMVDILSILCELGSRELIWHNFVKIGDNWIKICNLA